MIFATQRLYLTADKQRLVYADDADAATLYAAIGDQIPESAAVAFGLDTEGALMTTPNADWISLTEIDGIDRATARALALVGIYDARQLAEVDLVAVPALAGFGGTVDWPSWVAGAVALLAVQETEQAALDAEAQADAEAEAKLEAARDEAEAELAAREAAERAPGEIKERAPGENKERVPGETKEAPPLETPETAPAADGRSSDGTVASASPVEAPVPPKVSLDDIPGIGPATIRALAAIGITDAHQLAEIDPEAPPVLDGYRGAPDWAGWIGGARTLSPVAPAQMETIAGTPAAPAIAADAAIAAAE